MNQSLPIPRSQSTLPGKDSWQPFTAVAQALFWPDRKLASMWLITIGLLVIGLISQAGLPLFLGFFGLLGVHLSIPIQINHLTSRKSWLLLPGFKTLVMLLLAGLLLLWMLAIIILNLQWSEPNWILLPYTALAFSLIILPAIYVRHLWPLLAQLIFLVAIMTREEIAIWLKLHGTSFWFGAVLTGCTFMMWILMVYRWLHPAQQFRDQTERTSLFALYGIEIQWLMRLTRRPASLAGTQLLGDGDSWQASLVRASWATWMTPAVFVLIDLLFSKPDKPSDLWSEQFFMVLLTLCPLFTLAVQQQKPTQRLGRCWLYLNGDRSAMYGFVEKAFYQEFAAYLTMAFILICLLVPATMILPLLCYAGSATVLLCYLIFALSGRHIGWSISTNLLLLIALILAMDVLWASPNLIYLTSLGLLLPVYSLRRFTKNYWLRMDYSQLKPRQLV